MAFSIEVTLKSGQTRSIEIDDELHEFPCPPAIEATMQEASA
jgi:hypothetical protein